MCIFLSFAPVSNPSSGGAAHESREAIANGVINLHLPKIKRLHVQVFGKTVPLKQKRSTEQLTSSALGSSSSAVIVAAPSIHTSISAQRIKLRELIKEVGAWRSETDIFILEEDVSHIKMHASLMNNSLCL